MNRFVLALFMLLAFQRTAHAQQTEGTYALSLVGEGNPDVVVYSLDSSGNVQRDVPTQQCRVPCTLRVAERGFFEFAVSVQGQPRYRTRQRILRDGMTLDLPAGPRPATPPVLRPIETTAVVLTIIGATGLALGGTTTIVGLIMLGVCAPSMTECLAPRVVLYTGLATLGVGLVFAAIGTGINAANAPRAPRRSGWLLTPSVTNNELGLGLTLRF